MADLEKTFNQAEDSENISSVDSSNESFNFDNNEVTSPEENNPEIQPEIENQEISYSEPTTDNSVSETFAWDNSAENNFDNVNEIPSEPANNEPSFGSFENPINTDNEVSPINTGIDTQVSQPNVENQQKTKSAQKEKLALLVKAHESKAQKKWFTIWFLSGILLTICIAVAGFVFAKDQILNLLNDGNNNSSSIEINNPNDNYEIEDNEITDDEIIDDEITDDEIIDDEIIDDENITDEDIDNEAPVDENIDNENIDNETATDIENENINDENNTNPEVINDEIITDIDNTEILEDNTQWYTIIHVNTAEEANWVLPAHCSDLTCYGENDEFTACTKFREDPNLNSDSQRIWSSGACKYKDPSELVFVEFNN